MLDLAYPQNFKVFTSETAVCRKVTDDNNINNNDNSDSRSQTSSHKLILGSKQNEPEVTGFSNLCIF